jgi:hypothetical protein
MVPCEKLKTRTLEAVRNQLRRLKRDPGLLDEEIEEVFVMRTGRARQFLSWSGVLLLDHFFYSLPALLVRQVLVPFDALKLAG